LEPEYRLFGLVGQVKSDRRMLCLQLAGLKWGSVPGKGVNTDTGTGGLDLAGMAENRGNLGMACRKPISFSQKSGREALRINRVGIQPLLGHTRQPARKTAGKKERHSLLPLHRIVTP